MNRDPRLAPSGLGPTTKSISLPATNPPVKTVFPVHRREWALVVIVGAHLAFLPWALGAMHAWSQLVSLILSVTSLALSALPRRYPPSQPGARPYVVHFLPRLLRFPVFWCGAAFLTYVVIQALNPAWQSVPTRWGNWLRPVPHAGWLPSSVGAPFSAGNAWRSFVVWASAWMSACAIWTGLTRRRSLRWLLAILVANAWALGVLALLERASNATRIFWSWTPPAGYFVASFIYRNHAGAYFDLMLSATCALLWWYAGRRGRPAERSGRVVLLAFVVALLTATVLGSFSRGSVLLMLPVFGLSVATAVVQVRAQAEPRRYLRMVAATGALLGGGVIAALPAVHGDRLLARLEQLRTELASPGTNTRVLLARGTIQMASDAPWLGWGAGSFQYIFHGYQTRYPSILIAADSHRPLRFDHAHDDYLELWSELGLVGLAILATGFLWHVAALIRHRRECDAMVAFLVLGCAVTAVHATFDFPFANPAVLVTWCGLWSLLQRWIEIGAPPAPLPATHGIAS